MNKKLIIVGAFHEMIELCESAGYDIIGIIDNEKKKEFLSYPIIGNDQEAESLYAKYKSIPLVITPDTPSLREKLVNLYVKIGFNIETVISPKATISKYAKIGKGVVIQTGVNVSAFAEIKNFVKLNTYANVMHDVSIGNFTTIAPSAVLLGRVCIGEKCYVGANATVLPELTIENEVVVGAGAVVTKDINTYKIVKGVPAK